MPVEYCSDAATFARQAQPFLLDHEAENSLIFGIAIPGTVAPLPVAEAFAAAWCALSYDTLVEWSMAFEREALGRTELDRARFEQ